MEFTSTIIKGDLIEELKDFYQMFEHRHHLLEIMSNMRLECSSLNWSTKLGFNNAAYTGLISGFIWAIKGNIISYLDHNIFPVRDQSLHVEPVFSGKLFSFTIKGIFRTHLGNIILTGVKFMLFRIKGGFKQWPNTQLKN
jgi:hypothetical protein